MSIQRTLALLLFSACITSPAFSDDDRSWTNLGQLRPEERIGVIQSDQKRFEGRFAGFSDSGISIRADQVTTVPKENVIRVYRRPRAGRALRIGVGAAIGLAAGAVLNATVGQRFRNEGKDIAGALIGGGAAIGAGIGALSGGGNRTIYRRSPQP